ncbi:APC family permease [Phenylobacterium sp.]|uniref:APC family permease n=1 Tax=Phenylobacterium sp. TaxID=1871053 RepID=UPI0025FB301C|nr:APC family permease [Phenylobacterium sp.]
MHTAAAPLIRALSRRDLIGILVNTMIASGMMAAPAKVFALAQGWSFAVLGVSALLIAPLILSFAELGSRFSGTGGPYLYARAALPGAMAFSVGWLLWISQAFATATLANLLVTYLAGFVPALSSGLPRAAVLIALGVTVTAIALRGIRQSAMTSNVFAVLKLGFVVGFIVAGVAFIQPGHLEVRTPPPGPVTFAQAILIYIYAYLGFERTGVLAGEARDPKADVPVALLVSLAVATLAYALVLLVCVGVLDDPTATDRPLAEVGRQLFGEVGAAVISAGAILVILGTVLVATVAMGRLLLALAEAGQVPAVLGTVHRRWRTPHPALLISGALAFGFALISDLLTALTFSTATRVLCYILCCLALWRLSRRPDAPTPQFRLPARGVVALVSAAIFTVVLVVGATKEVPALAGVLAVGLGLFALTRWRARVRAPAPV